MEGPGRIELPLSGPNPNVIPIYERPIMVGPPGLEPGT